MSLRRFCRIGRAVIGSSHAAVSWASSTQIQARQAHSRYMASKFKMRSPWIVKEYMSYRIMPFMA